MSTVIGTFRLEHALKAENFPLPEDCAEARLVMEPNSPFQIEYRVNVTTENLAKLGRALQRLAEAVPDPPAVKE